MRVPVNGKKAGDKMSYTLLNMDQDTRYTVAIIAEDPWMNLSSVSSISFGTPVNEPPVLSTDASQPVQVTYNRMVRVTYLVTDPDSKDFTYELTDPSGAVTPVKEQGNFIWIYSTTSALRAHTRCISPFQTASGLRTRRICSSTSSRTSLLLLSMLLLPYISAR